MFVCVGREGEALPDLTTLNNSLTITNQQPINGTTNIIKNNSYGFAVFFTREDAAAAAEKLNGRPLLGRPARAAPSTTANHRLFIGGVPHALTASQLKDRLSSEVVGALCRFCCVFVERARVF